MPPKTYVNYPDPTTIDCRVYNLQVFLPDSQDRMLQNYEFNGQEQQPTPTPPDTATPFNQIVVGAFYRIHSTRTAKGYSATPCNANIDCPASFPICDQGVHQCFNNSEAGCNGQGPDGSTNVCCEKAQDTNQIGCLTIANPCSIGYSGLPSLTRADPSQQLITQPVAGGAQVAELNFSIGLDKVVNGSRVVTSASADNACIPADNAAAATYQYPITPNLYLSSIVGFESPQLSAAELALAQCMSGRAAAIPPATINAMIKTAGFVPNAGGACCKDFDESVCGAPNCSSDADCTGTASTCNLTTQRCTNSNACLGNNAPGVSMPANNCAF
jgi:hypothetical protein